MREPRPQWRTSSVFRPAVRLADLLLDTFGRALRLVLPLVTPAQLREAGRLRLGQVESIDLLGEAEICVDARDHDPRVDRDQLDPDHRDAYVRIDHETLVEDQIDDIRQPARARSPLQVVARRPLGRYRHRVLLLSLCRLAPLRAPLGTLVAAARQLALRQPLDAPCAAGLPAAVTETGHVARPIGQLPGEVSAARDCRASLFLELVGGAPGLGCVAEPGQYRALEELGALLGDVPRRHARTGGDERRHHGFPDTLGATHASSSSSLPIRSASPFANAAATPTAAAVAAPFAVVRSAGESGVTSSSTPSIAPSVIFSAPFSCNSGSPPSSVWLRSSRLTCSATRRYVSTLAITIRASIVISSIPITAIRTYASITSPLSRIRSTTSASPLGLGARCR